MYKHKRDTYDVHVHHFWPPHSHTAFRMPHECRILAGRCIISKVSIKQVLIFNTEEAGTLKVLRGHVFS